MPNYRKHTGRKPRPAIKAQSYEPIPRPVTLADLADSGMLLGGAVAMMASARAWKYNDSKHKIANGED